MATLPDEFRELSFNYQQGKLSSIIIILRAVDHNINFGRGDFRTDLINDVESLSVIDGNLGRILQDIIYSNFADVESLSVIDGNLLRGDFRTDLINDVESLSVIDGNLLRGDLQDIIYEFKDPSAIKKASIQFWS
jgi:hypothetical protein